MKPQVANVRLLHEIDDAIYEGFSDARRARKLALQERFEGRR